MPTFQITVENPGEVAKFFERFEDALKDVSDAWPLVVEEFYAIEQEQFNSQGRGRWPALSPAYARWKASKYPGRSLLVLEGRLKAAATGGSGVVVDKQPRQLAIGIREPVYWQYHQTGTSAMPQRKVVDLRKEDKERLLRQFTQGVRDIIRKAGK